jgi:sporulation protein YlmC with PRC-barrel domain
VLGASTLTGEAVLDARGEAIGTIREIMLDVPRGRIAYAVLAFEDLEAAARKLFAVPWEALRVDGQRRCFVIDTDREHLRNAPGFDPQHWPSMAQPTWISALYEFYGVDPRREQ